MKIAYLSGLQELSNECILVVLKDIALIITMCLQGHVHIPGMPYDFNYAVKDDYFGTDYSHNAISDGDVVKGQYRVVLPDGRTQIVSYTADWKTGFHADVQYQGEPRYPPAAPRPPAQGPYGPPQGPPAQGPPPQGPPSQPPVSGPY